MRRQTNKKQDITSICTAIQKSRDNNDDEIHMCRQNGRSRSEQMLDMITRHRRFLVLLLHTSASE